MQERVVFACVDPQGPWLASPEALVTTEPAGRPRLLNGANCTVNEQRAARYGG
jgi:hypothetical protein